MHNNLIKQSQTTNQSDLTDKKPYHTPTLSHFGDVNDLTKSNAFSGNSGGDGGSFPNSYNS